ncbi:MAG: T9SS type A sorting domain-containing protein [Paludibacteraceae bacterium]|nr:T9SS type A sorting domain-containing protein [Paludibacteraceae bacterium]
MLVSFDKSDVEQEVNVDKIGDWGVFDEIKVKKMQLVEGVQNMLIKNTGSWIDIDWIKFEKDGVGVDVYAADPITIAPNPASDRIEINGVTPLSVEVISTTGVVLKKVNDNTLSVSDLAKGNYIVRVVTENAVIVKKLVVEK